jgi:hypothetical protein
VLWPPGQRVDLPDRFDSIAMITNAGARRRGSQRLSPRGHLRTAPRMSSSEAKGLIIRERREEEFERNAKEPDSVCATVSLATSSAGDSLTTICRDLLHFRLPMILLNLPVVRTKVHRDFIKDHTVEMLPYGFDGST